MTPAPPYPKLTAPVATIAARYLWHYAVGETFTGKVKLTTGNRHTWCRGGVLYVNPDNGWEKFVDDLAWLFVRRANSTDTVGITRAFIAKIKQRLWKEINKRGWLTWEEHESPDLLTYVMKADALATRRRKKLESIDRLLVQWERKLSRAERAIAKLHKQRRYYAKVTDETML